MCGDFVAYKLDRLAFAGAQADPLAALLFCAPQQPDVVVVNGRVIVQDGQLTTIDLPPVVERHNRISMEALKVTPITRPERYWLLTEKGDEVLDYREAVTYFSVPGRPF